MYNLDSMIRPSTAKQIDEKRYKRDILILKYAEQLVKSSLHRERGAQSKVQRVRNVNAG